MIESSLTPASLAPRGSSGSSRALQGATSASQKARALEAAATAAALCLSAAASITSRRPAASNSPFAAADPTAGFEEGRNPVSSLTLLTVEAKRATCGTTRARGGGGCPLCCCCPRCCCCCCGKPPLAGSTVHRDLLRDRCEGPLSPREKERAQALQTKGKTCAAFFSGRGSAALGGRGGAPEAPADDDDEEGGRRAAAADASRKAATEERAEAGRSVQSGPAGCRRHCGDFSFFFFCEQNERQSLPRERQRASGGGGGGRCASVRSWPVSPLFYFFVVVVVCGDKKKGTWRSASSASEPCESRGGFSSLSAMAAKRRKRQGRERAVLSAGRGEGNGKNGASPSERASEDTKK